MMESVDLIGGGIEARRISDHYMTVSFTSVDKWRKGDVLSISGSVGPSLCSFRADDSQQLMVWRLCCPQLILPSGKQRLSTSKGNILVLQYEKEKTSTSITEKHWKAGKKKFN